MSEKKNVPKLRFPEFTEPWEQRKLGELVGIYDGVHQTPEYQDSGIMFLSVENIATLKSEKYISEEAFERDYKVYPEKGDILMTRIGDVGTTNVVETAEKVAFYVSLALLKPNGIDSYFLSNAMKTNVFQKGLRERTLVTAIPQKINKDEIGKIDIFITNDDEEQKKIGTYFSTLDNLITLHQRKLDHVKDLKKSMLQKMFPKNGQLYPEVRFPEFTDAWEQRKLGEVAIYRRGSFPQPYGKSEWYDGEEAKPFVQVADVTDVMNLVDDTKQKISKLAQPMSVFAEKGSVLVTLQGSIGRVAITQYGAFVDRTVLIFEKYKTEIDNLFWAYVIKQKFVEEARKAPGGTIKTITKEALSDFDLLLPNYNEQKKIGDYFSTLDTLITLHQRELDHLKLLKKGMLQQMFV